jgi:hypothetical protein
MTPQDRYKIASNIIARRGIADINLHAELAKAEFTANLMDSQMDAPVAPIQGDTGTISPPMEQSANEGETMPQMA